MGKIHFCTLTPLRVKDLKIPYTHWFSTNYLIWVEEPLFAISQSQGWEENPFPPASILAAFICPMQQKRRGREREADTAVTIAEIVGIHSTGLLQFLIYFCEPSPSKCHFSPEECLTLLCQGRAAWSPEAPEQSRGRRVRCVSPGWSTGLGRRRTFGVGTPGLELWPNMGGGSGSPAPLHTGVTHSSSLDAWWYL